MSKALHNPYIQTIINNATVEDGQVVYIEGTEIVYIKVTQLESFKSDVYRSADLGKTWTKQTTPEVLKEYADEGIIRIFSAQPNKKEVCCICDCLNERRSG
jgi:hypothetical protein